MILVSLLLAGQGAQPAYAASFTVNSLADNTTNDAFCTLREAILAANNAPANANCGPGSAANDTITFSVSGTIILTSTLPNIVSGQGTLTIDGGGNITISGNSSVRVMYVNTGANLTLQNLTIANGYSSGSEGGGLYNNGGMVTVTNSTFSNNSAEGYGGGGIYNWGGTVTVTNSTFSGNSATYGGGIFKHFGGGTLTVTNSTFSNNSASFNGGGIYISSGTVAITNSTFSGNSANYGGGISNNGTGVNVTNSTFSGNSAATGGGGLTNGTGSTINFKNSIIANSSSGGNCSNFGSITATGTNFDTDGTCSGFTTTTTAALNLGPLANNGGPTQTRALLAGSVAINAATGGCPPPATDQRGISRPQGAACDVGAYERDDTPPALVSFTRFNPATSPTNADVLVFRAAFSEDVQNVNAADFQVNSTSTATITTVTQVSPSLYEITVSGGDLAIFNGTVGLNVAAGQNITDLAGNPLPTAEPATDEIYVVDNTAPALISFTRFNPATSPTNADVLVFRATFNENVQNVDAADFQVNSTSTATITTVTQVSPSLYEITVSGGDLATFNGTVGLDVVVGHNITDLAGNFLLNAEPSTDEIYVVDNTAPALVSFTRFNPATSPTNADVLVFRAAFSEDVQNVNAADFQVNSTSTATITAVTQVNPSLYEITVSGGNLATFNGTVGLNLAAMQNIADLAGNPLPTAEPTTDEIYVVDNTAPALVSFTRFNPATSPTNDDVLVFRATFNENVQNVDAADFQVNSTSTAVITTVTQVSPSLYEITVSGGDLATFNGTVGLNIAAGQNITDLVGNPLPTAEPSTDEIYTVDNTALALVSFTRFNPATSPTNADVLIFHATFDEDVQNVDAADFDVDSTSTATITAVTQVSPSLYEITISGGDLATFNGTVGLNLAATQDITDLAGNSLPTAEPATDEIYTMDNSVSLVSFTRFNPAASPTNADVLIFRATFDEAVQNVDAADFDVDSTSTATITAVTQVSPSLYEITISGGDLATFNGTVGLNVAAGQDITDLVGNPLPTAEPATDEIYVVDNTVPLVAAQSLQPTYQGSGPASFTVNFNMNVYDPPGNSDPDDVTNPANYLLIEKGPNGLPDTASCSGGVAGDDLAQTVTAVSYSPNTATVTLTGPLPLGNYRLFVCGTTSIVSAATTPLNNGADFTFDFVVQPAATSLPATGFPMGRVSVLSPQPQEKAYAATDLMLEIPSLKVKAPIVGVLKSDGSWDVSWLGNAVGWLEGSAFPTWQGNTVLTAHVWDADNTPGLFANLKDLKYGDRFTIHAYGQTYIYEVRENTRLWGANRIDKVFRPEELDWVTLLTCEGYNPLSGNYLFRRMVRAVLVGVK